MRPTFLDDWYTLSCRHRVRTISPRIEGSPEIFREDLDNFDERFLANQEQARQPVAFCQVVRHRLSGAISSTARVTLPPLGPQIETIAQKAHGCPAATLQHDISVIPPTWMDPSDASTEDVWRHPYVALEPQSRQIRLLHLWPGQPESPIECSTSIVSFDDKFTDYEALSYVWGERLYYGWISLDGSFFPVTENLSGALNGLRYTDRERVLWIDAICIDQANLRERSEQVSRMHSIFTQASTVIVWLGEEWDTTDLALGFFTMFGLDIKPNVKFPTLQPPESENDEVNAETVTEEIHATSSSPDSGGAFGSCEDDEGYDVDLEDHADEAHGINPEVEEDGNKERVFNVDFTMRVKTLTLDPVSGGPEERTGSPHTGPTKGFKDGQTAIDGGPIAKAVKRFMNFPWWTRIWTVQEFVLAGSSVFHCGKYTIDGAVLLQCVRHLERHDRQFSILERNIQPRSEDNKAILYSQLDGRRKRQCCTLDFDDFPLDDLEEALYPLIALHWVKTIYMTFLRQVDLFRVRNASDHRDKVYGVMALTADSFVRSILPDYQAPVETIFEDLAVSMIRSTQQLDVLSHIVPDRRRRLNVPSYVPDWTIPLDVTSILTWSTRVTSTDLYNACNHTPARLLVRSGSILIRGVCFDSIERIATNYLNPHRLVDPGYSNKVLNEIRQLAGLGPDTGTQDVSDDIHSKLQAFWLTVCGGLAEVPSQANFGVHDVDQAMSQYRRLYTITDFRHYQEWEAWFRASFVERLRIQSASKSKFEAITSRIATVTWGRVFMVTRTGCIGFIPKDALEDDLIAVLTGGRVPIVLRPKDEYYIVVGDAYVHGIMDGEAIEDCSGELQDLELR